MSEHDRFQRALGNYFAGNLSEKEAEEIEIHLLSCHQCQERLQTLEEESIQDLVIQHKPTFESVFGKTPGSPRAQDSIWKRLKNRLALRVLIPATAAVAVLIAAVVTVVTITTPRTVPLRRATTLEDATLMVRRGGAVTIVSKRTHKSESEAVTAEFRSLVHYDIANREFRIAERHPMVRDSSRVVELRVVGATGEQRAEFRVPIPADCPRRLKLWVLTLPSKHLYEGEKTTSDRIRIEWGHDMETTGCLAFTYSVKGGYRTAVGFPFEFR